MSRKSDYLLPSDIADWSFLSAAEKSACGAEFLKTPPTQYAFEQRMSEDAFDGLTRPQRDAIEKWLDIVTFGDEGDDPEG